MIRITIEIDTQNNTVNVHSDKELTTQDGSSQIIGDIVTPGVNKEPRSYKTKVNMSENGNFPASWDKIIERFKDRFIPFTLKDVAGTGAKPQHKAALTAYLKKREDLTFTEFSREKRSPYRFFPVRYENGKQIIASDDPPIERNVIKGGKIQSIKRRIKEEPELELLEA